MINDFELKVMRMLGDDARLTVQDIALRLGAAEEQVDEAARKLERERVIVKYGAIIDWERAGDQSVQALIEVRVTPQRDIGFDAIAKRIYRFDEVKTCALMSGGYDLMVMVEADSMRKLALFVAEKLSVMDNVLSCATHFILRKYKTEGVILADAVTDKRQAVSP